MIPLASGRLSLTDRTSTGLLIPFPDLRGCPLNCSTDLIWAATMPARPVCLSGQCHVHVLQRVWTDVASQPSLKTGQLPAEMLRQPGAAALPWAAASQGAARQSRLAPPLVGASPAAGHQSRRQEAGQSPAWAHSPFLAAAALLLDLRQQARTQLFCCGHQVSMSAILPT